MKYQDEFTDNKCGSFGPGWSGVNLIKLFASVTHDLDKLPLVLSPDKPFRLSLIIQVKGARDMLNLGKNNCN